MLSWAKRNEGPRDEEVNETIHENFDEKECYDNGCKPLMLIMRVFKVVDEKRENEVREVQSVKDGARSTKERTLTSSENKTTFETPCEIDEYFYSSVNAEMLTIAVRT